MASPDFWDHIQTLCLTKCGMPSGISSGCSTRPWRFLSAGLEEGLDVSCAAAMQPTPFRFSAER